jgi:hypothetical protein
MLLLPHVHMNMLAWWQNAVKQHQSIAASPRRHGHAISHFIF